MLKNLRALLIELFGNFADKSAIPIHDGKLWSPYFVFIKGTEMTYREVLGELGLGRYVKIDSIERRFDYLAIGRDSLWTHVIDNFGYTHWHSKAFKDAVANLGTRRDVFSFSVGDIDYSYDLLYYCSGKLIRQIVWEDPKINGGQLKHQSGPALAREETIIQNKDPIKGLWQVASALGIESDYTKINLMVYAPKP